MILTGANGGVGSIMQRMAPRYGNISLLPYAKNELDITDADALALCFNRAKPQYVLNTAAYTNVDMAEKDTAAAYRLNAGCLSGMVAACRECGAVLIHLSTDYVFDGKKLSPYTEDDRPAPVNEYGKSKREGERIVLSYEKGVVVRTSWVYSLFAKNFLAAIPRLLAERKEPLYVDSIQVNSPTFAPDLADALYKLAGQGLASGLYQYTSEGGGCDRYTFATRIRELMTGGVGSSSGIPAPVLPLTEDAGTDGAPRPLYTVMSPALIGKKLGLDIPHWEDRLVKFLRNEI